MIASTLIFRNHCILLDTFDPRLPVNRNQSLCSFFFEQLRDIILFVHTKIIMTSPSGRINPSAQNGFSNAALYDKHRPSFPAHSVSVLLDGVRVADSPQATVVDLAAGTGKFTELLADRDEGYEIIAIEPHADMRKVLEDKHLKGVTVQDGLSTDMKSLKDESVDAVIAAQVGH